MPPERTILALLLEPLAVRGKTLPNRIIMSPMSRTISPDDVPGAGLADFYAKLAEGGVGTIFTEAARIEHIGAIGYIGLSDNIAPYTGQHLHDSEHHREVLAVFSGPATTDGQAATETGEPTPRSAEATVSSKPAIEVWYNETTLSPTQAA